MNYPRLVRSFQHAFSGLFRVLVHEQNFKIHTLIAVSVIALAAILGFRRTDWLILLLTIGMVTTLEILNTLVEDVVDVLRPRIHEGVRIIKDGAAAAVLLASMVSVIIGVILFLPYFLP